MIGVANVIVEKYGGKIYCDTHVEGVEGGDPCTVKITGDKKLTAKSGAVCTNASISEDVTADLTDITAVSTAD
jgi:hypothetical protein